MTTEIKPIFSAPDSPTCSGEACPAWYRVTPLDTGIPDDRARWSCQYEATSLPGRDCVPALHRLLCERAEEVNTFKRRAELAEAGVFCNVIRDADAKEIDGLRRKIGELREELDAAVKSHTEALLRMSEAEVKWVAEKMRLDFILSFAEVEDVGDEETVYGLTFRIDDLESATLVGGKCRWTPRRFIDMAICVASSKNLIDGATSKEEKP